MYLGTHGKFDAPLTNVRVEKVRELLDELRGVGLVGQPMHVAWVKAQLNGRWWTHCSSHFNRNVRCYGPYLITDSPNLLVGWHGQMALSHPIDQVFFDGSTEEHIV